MLTHIWGNAFIIFGYFLPYHNTLTHTLAHTEPEKSNYEKKLETQREKSEPPTKPTIFGIFFFSESCLLSVCGCGRSCALVDAKEIWRQFYAKSGAKKEGER